MDDDIKIGDLRGYYKVCQANPLIMASFRVSATAYKVFLCAVSQIGPDDSEFRYYRFKIEDFKRMAGITGSKKDYFDILEKAVNELRSSSVTIKKKDKTGRINTPLAVTIDENTIDGTVGLTFPPELRPFLLELKKYGNYTIYDIENITTLRSYYSIRIYQFCKYYNNLKNTKWRFEISELRAIFCINKKAKYSFADFKRRVLNQAKKEISVKTDMFFDYELEKHGRSYKWVIFIFGKAASYKDIDISKDILDMLPVRCKTDKVLIDFLSNAVDKKGEAFVMKNIFYTIKNSKSNFSRYLMLSIEKDWSDGKDMTPNNEANNSAPVSIPENASTQLTRAIKCYNANLKKPINDRCQSAWGTAVVTDVCRANCPKFR